MAHHEQNGTADEPSPPASVAPSTPLTPKGASRRRMAGLGVSGVVMTVASNHAMAAIMCRSPSGALSGNLASRQPEMACNGAKPEHWALPTTPWPSEVRTNDRFSRFFDSHGPLGGASTLEVLTGSSHDEDQVAKYVMAMYLNVCSGRSNFMTRQAVKDLWVKYYRSKSYTPVGGATPWSGPQLVSYLSSTMG